MVYKNMVILGSVWEMNSLRSVAVRSYLARARVCSAGRNNDGGS